MIDNDVTEQFEYELRLWKEKYRGLPNSINIGEEQFEMLRDTLGLEEDDEILDYKGIPLVVDYDQEDDFYLA